MKDFYNGALEMEMDVAPETGQSDHRLLSNRDAKNQHPITSVEGLREELDEKGDDIRKLQQLSGNISDIVEGAGKTLEEIQKVQNSSVQAVLTAELEAHEHIRGSVESAAKSAASAQELRNEIQGKLDSGEFKGEKGDPFTYEDFTEEQIEALKGAPVTIIDNLDSTLPDAALSANQGRALNEKIGGIGAILDAINGEVV